MYTFTSNLLGNLFKETEFGVKNRLRHADPDFLSVHIPSQQIKCIKETKSF